MHFRFIFILFMGFQKTLNSCCFSSLASAFANINHFNTANTISMRIEESLKSEVGNRIDLRIIFLKTSIEM